jgi:hypothetical protein
MSTRQQRHVTYHEAGDDGWLRWLDIKAKGDENLDVRFVLNPNAEHHFAGVLVGSEQQPEPLEHFWFRSLRRTTLRRPGLPHVRKGVGRRTPDVGPGKACPPAAARSSGVEAAKTTI